MDNRGLIIFDLDGTLFKSHIVWIPAVQFGFQCQGLKVPDDKMICSFIGKPASEFHKWIHSLYPDSATDLVTIVERRELELIPDGELYSGFPDILIELHSSGAQMAICTNGAQEYVERVIGVHNLGLFFDKVRFRQSAKDNKPAMVRELLDALESRPAIVIGDLPDDIDAAHQNNLKAIAASYGYGTTHELQKADLVAESPQHLLELVYLLLPPRNP
jgi:phosphoglycolate phosphatase